MATQYTDLGFPYPQATDAADGPAALQALADAADDRPGIKVYTTAQIAALTAAQKPAGLVVFDSTAQKLKVSDGSAFVDLLTHAAAVPLAGGTMTGPLLLPDGSVSAPALSNDGDPNTGLYFPAANSVALATDGVARLSIDSAGLITGTGTSLGAWTDCSSTTSLTWTGFSAGTSSASAFYCRIGKLVFFRGAYTFAGATFPTSGTAFPTLNLPVSADTSPGASGISVLTDAGSNDYSGLCGLANSGAIAFHAMGAAGSYSTRVLTAYNVPHTWANTDAIAWQIAYEAA